MRPEGVLPRRLPLALVRFGARRPAQVLLVAALAWAVAIVLAFQVSVDTDILSLVPRNNPVVHDFKTTIERFGTVDTLLVVVHLHGERELTPALDFADRLARSLRSSELISWVEYRVDDIVPAAVPLLDRATLFLDPEEVDQLLARLDEEGLRAAAHRLRARLMTPHSVATESLFRLDPLGLLPKVLGGMPFGGTGLPVEPESGVLVDPSHELLLMIARPVRPAQDLAFDRELAHELDRRVESVRREWSEEGWEGPAPKVSFSGGYIIAFEDSILITRDAFFGLGSALAGVMALFLLAFRRRAALLYAFVPLLTGLALTFVFMAAVLGRVNSITSAFGGLLIGLGIDFIIVLYGRYVEERRRGSTHEQAVDAMGRTTAVGVLLGAVTTSATFYAFLVTDFQGLSELGLITGTGILLVVATVYLTLPALLTLLQGRRPHRGGLSLRSFGSDLLCRAALRRPGWTLVVTGVVTAACAVAMTDLGFDDDMRNLRSRSNRGEVVRRQVSEAFGLRFSPMTVRVDGATEAEALEAARELVPRLESLVDGDTLVSVDAIAHAIPSQDRQEEVIRRLAAGAGRVQGVEERLAAALREEGLNPTAFAEGIRLVGDALRAQHPLTVDDFQGTPLEAVLRRYLVRHDDGASAAIYLYRSAENWREVPEAVREVVDSHPSAVLSGPNVVSAELRRIVWGDAAEAAVIGLVLVFLLLWADLGSPVRSLLALAPLLVGLVWMLGGMALLGMPINFFNIFVITMLIGIGVDYGVHLLHRWSESGGSPEAVAETAKAVAVAALTTMVGFGSLVLSSFPALRSVGVTAILGAICTALLGITFLPVLLQKFLPVPHRDA